MTGSTSLGCDDHNDRADLPYGAWHEWAERRLRTHECIQCPECGLWKIWVERGL